MFTTRKTYQPYRSPFDPCPPLTPKTYVTAPNLYIGFQPPRLPQYAPYEALRKGTTWKIFYDPYCGPYEQMKRNERT
ncbi:spore coat protein JA [Thermolongibacillus altinsuensis]|jgi:spore coat protein JA|uniref:Spore coat protein JA n=1 Tax=Thermolongibacillus altinsuensis TaxID=575256 RepID=A0A4R1QLR2_9BACL|nr:spore coat associated protein CotJA [Thermolongibacillus altinsuensis]TCL53135.1 spore coat protein JA [Thermolongibacillus altinsuensis]GMB07838.1 hypothetical protein B1no1_05480 [Thermolongibacillus altinsuensis]